VFSETCSSSWPSVQRFIAVKGWAAPEVERAYTRTRELCERLGDPPELFPALLGLWAVYYLRGELPKAYELAELLLRRAHSAQDPTLLLYAHLALGCTSFSMGEWLLARDPSRNGDLPL
jgi:predicted ATPase